jgi:hypothetical protein
VSDAATQRLQVAGVTVNARVPQGLLRDLLQQRLIYTRGTGRSTTDDEPIPYLGDDPGSLPLKIAATARGHSLALLLPAIPKEWLVDLHTSAFSRDLALFGLDTAGGYVSAVALLPIHCGAAVEVRPGTGRYDVRPSGAWPATWITDRWVCGAAGLHPAGTLFTGLEDDGIRLGPTTPVRLGGEYLCLTQDRSARLQARYAFSRHGGSVDVLEPLEGWDLLVLRMPDRLTPEASDWCVRRGYRLASAPWRLAIVAPPPQSTLIDGTPIYCAEDRLLVEAASTGDGRTAGPVALVIRDQHQREQSTRLAPSGDEPNYVELRPGAAGLVRLSIVDQTGALATTRAMIGPVEEQDAPDRAEGGRPLALAIRFPESDAATLCSMPEAPPSAASSLAVPRRGEPEVMVDLPAAAHAEVRWASPRNRGRVATRPASDVSRVVAEILALVQTRRAEVRITVDAGAFGHLTMVASPAAADTPADPPPARPPGALERWFAAVGLGLRAAPRSTRRRAPLTPSSAHAHPRGIGVRLTPHNGLMARAAAFHGVTPMPSGGVRAPDDNQERSGAPAEPTTSAIEGQR